MENTAENRDKPENQRYIYGKFAKRILSCPDYWCRIDGSIWSTKRGKIKRLKTSISNSGYPTVQIVGIQRKNVHILMLETFYGQKPTPQHVGKHWNDNPTDNNIMNLTWGLRGSIDDVANAEPNSFFPLTNMVDRWFNTQKALGHVLSLSDEIRYHTSKNSKELAEESYLDSKESSDSIGKMRHGGY